MQGRPEKALHLLVKAMDIFPDWATPYQYAANHLMGLGRLDEAVAWATLANTLTDDPMTIPKPCWLEPVAPDP